MEVFNAEDLIAEILGRLPARAIGRCRCVCRRWRSLTSDPKFVLAHASRAPTSGFFCKDGDHFFLDNRPYSLTLPPPPPGRSNFTVESSCNGLVLLKQRPIDGPPSYFVCNPVTMQSWPAISHPENNIVFIVDLAFDPSRSADFKIVGYCSSSRLLVYSSRTRIWRPVGDAADPFKIIIPRANVYWNGHVLWDICNDCLLCFDVDEERFGRVERPPDEIHCEQLAVSGGSLHYIVSPDSLRYRIWESMPDLSGWSLLRSVVLDAIPGLPSYWTANVIYFHRGSGGHDDQLFICIPGNVYSYHLHAKTFTTLSYDLWPEVFPHAETLTSP